MSSEERRRAAVVTVSDGVAEGTRTDESGPAVRNRLVEAGFEVTRREVVGDEQRSIETLLTELSLAASLVVTTGGTGLAPRDVTPEATRAVIDREVPGLAEEMRASGRTSTPMAGLSRGIAGTRGSCLILNLPGSTQGAIQSLEAVLPAIPHALDLLAGHTAHSASHIENQVDEPGPARSQPPAEAHVIATAVKVHGDPPCEVGQKALIGRTGALSGTLGCAEFDDAAVADAPAVLDGRSPVLRTYVHDLGSVEVFLEPSAARPTLIVFAATPVALNLLRWGRELGFNPVLVESRHEKVRDEFRSAARVVNSVEDLDLDSETAAVHTDHDAPGVAESVAALLRSPARFIGVMGSARHVGPYLEELRQIGFGENDLERIHTPVGLDIGARTAEEIALSILAGVTAERRHASGEWLDGKSKTRSS